MRCSFCNANAIISLRYAKLRLCPEHLSSYLERKVLRTINRYGLIKRNDKVLIAASGGKDSATLAHILYRLKDYLGIELVGMHINLGIGEYSIKLEKAFRELFERLAIPYVILSLKDIAGITLPDIVRMTRRVACSVCGLIKRYLMNLTAYMLNANKLATGHVLEDIVQFIIKEFLTADFDRLSKLKPLLEGTPDGKLVTKIRPLYEVRGKESLTYAIVNNLPFVYDTCPLIDERMMVFKIRRLIDNLELEHPGLSIYFLRKYNSSFIKYLENLGMNKTKFSTCNICGMPSTSHTCGFCRLMLRIDKDPLDVLAKVRLQVETMT